MINKHYVPALDGLRAFSLALVVLHHLSYRVAPGGRIGVDIFFVLSGFLITSILLRERDRTGHISLPAFYARRVLRLMPALSVMVLCELAFALTFGGPGPNVLGSSVASVTYLMDFVRAFSSYSELSAVGHTWSLAVEEHFYILWPVLLGPVMRLPGRLRAPTMLAMAGGVALWRTYLVVHGASLDRTYYAFDARSDQLLVGCALAAWLAYGGGPAAAAAARLGRLWPFALAGLLAIAFLGDGAHNAAARAAGPIAVAALAAILIMELIGTVGFLSRIASKGLVVAFGRMSYGIYLWHWPFLIDTQYHTQSKIIAFAAVGVSFAVAALSFHFVEKPTLRLKHRFERGGEAGVAFFVGAMHTSQQAVAAQR